MEPFRVTYYPANTQRWFNVDISWNNVAKWVNVISTLILRRFVNVDSSINFNVETTLILGPEACNFIKREALAQVFSCEFCEISKNTFLTEPLWATASVNLWTNWYWYTLSSHFFLLQCFITMIYNAWLQHLWLRFFAKMILSFCLLTRLSAPSRKLASL